ncbi:MAG: TlpA family protein disulfide reductase [Vulcanimicrobiaceae bacterium]
MAKAVRAFCAIVALSLPACGSHRPAADGAHAKVAPAVAAIGELAPAWSDPALSGSTLTSASFRGKPVYLNFFASWCEPCNEEASSIQGLSKKYAASGVTVVGVDVEENAAKAGGFERAHGLTYPVVVDSGSMRDAYGVDGLPEHVFIDRDGVVHDLVEGEMQPSEIEAQIRAIAARSGR